MACPITKWNRLLSVLSSLFHRDFTFTHKLCPRSCSLLFFFFFWILAHTRYTHRPITLVALHPPLQWIYPSIRHTRMSDFFRYHGSLHSFQSSGTATAPALSNIFHSVLTKVRRKISNFSFILFFSLPTHDSRAREFEHSGSLTILFPPLPPYHSQSFYLHTHTQSRGTRGENSEQISVEETATTEIKEKNEKKKDMTTPSTDG